MQKRNMLAWLISNTTSSSGNSEVAGTITVGLAATAGGAFVRITFALSFSSKLTVRVGTCPFGVYGGSPSDETLDERRTDFSSSVAMPSCLAANR